MYCLLLCLLAMIRIAALSPLVRLSACNLHFPSETRRIRKSTECARLSDLFASYDYGAEEQHNASEVNKAVSKHHRCRMPI